MNPATEKSATRVGLIFAKSRNNVIGINNALPWHLPEDLAHFKRTTQGHPVIMGRKTWDSLPERFRPLPGRTNIVLTRQPGWMQEGAVVAASMDEALHLVREAAQVWVIGGSQVYEAALPYADTAVVTVVDVHVEGDAYGPELSPEDWTAQQGPLLLSTTGVGYQIAEYEKREQDSKEQLFCKEAP